MQGCNGADCMSTHYFNGYMLALPRFISRLVRLVLLLRLLLVYCFVLSSFFEMYSPELPYLPPPHPSFYDENDIANDPNKAYWSVERLKTGLRIGKREYNDILIAIEDELEAQNILGETLLRKTDRAHQHSLQQVVRNVEWRFWPIFSRAPEPWRGRCLWKLIYRANNNFRERRSRRLNGRRGLDSDPCNYPQEWHMPTESSLYPFPTEPTYTITGQWQPFNTPPADFDSGCAYPTILPDPLAIPQNGTYFQQPYPDPQTVPTRYTKFIGIEQQDTDSRQPRYNVLFVPVEDGVPVGPRWTFPDWTRTCTNRENVEAYSDVIPSMG
ncbi:uncharacterized protein K452DRAFT_34571 [Aplosporella prunicola CBS 121167]|uniref:Uncharacterized protein n=1 Tax=Aplosporella prunicola CBS 121167 TaxID=1176127 RepID=A0A6A6BEA0_9PEZI|nr:uncharacterized protein K452DRAFT_34571 [Aplosporella prunicola CBS 121167]KAF2141848.1 hypothetical protein K452DRAFT_34571 [Aplosporella prunicola CBS 121167]